MLNICNNQLCDFIRESNRIEGINYSDNEELARYLEFISLENITLQDMERLVSFIQPEAKLRAYEGMNVTVGKHVPPPGSIAVPLMLEDLLKDCYMGRHMPKLAYQYHHRYETLHPFTDGNGRSGRALWLWMMGDSMTHRGFLHEWYYQSLEFGGKR